MINCIVTLLILVDGLNQVSNDMKIGRLNFMENRRMSKSGRSSPRKSLDKHQNGNIDVKDFALAYKKLQSKLIKQALDDRRETNASDSKLLMIDESSIRGGALTDRHHSNR